MAQFITPNPKLEVSSIFIRSTLETMGKNTRKLEQILYKEEILLDSKQSWYQLQSFLNVMKYISQKYSPNTLFQIGKSVANSLQFSSKVNSIQTALEALESVIQNSHNNGTIGSYQLIKFDKNAQEIHFECENPYPCYFDRGLLTQVTKRFMPKTATLVNVELNKNLPSRISGSNKSFYTIFWM